MTYGPPPEPNAYSAPPQPHPQQPWSDPHGRAWPGGPPPVAPPKGFGPAVFAVVFGLLGCAVPLLPINLDNMRAYTPFPFALPGLALAVLGCIGRRRGKPLAVVGWMLSLLALILGLIMVGGRVIDASSGTSGSADRTQQILRDDLNVSFGHVDGDTEANQRHGFPS